MRTQVQGNKKEKHSAHEEDEGEQEEEEGEKEGEDVEEEELHPYDDEGLVLLRLALLPLAAGLDLCQTLPAHFMAQLT